MPRRSFALTRRKVSIAIATSALLFIGVTANATESIGPPPITVESGGEIPVPGGTVINPNFTQGVHFFCTDAITKELSYGGAGSKANCKTNSTSFGVVVTSTAFTQSTSIDDLYFCIDFNRLDILPGDGKSVTCIDNVNVIKVARIDPAKFPNNHNFICEDIATRNLTDGGSGSIPVPKTVASNCYSISATTSETTIPTINVSIATELTPGVHFFCADTKTKDLSYGGSGSKAKCKANSSSFGVVVTSLTRTKGGQQSDEIFCINLKTADIRYDPFAFPCSPNFSMIFVATKKTDPAKYTQGLHFICLIHKTQYVSYETLSYGGSGSKAKPKTVASDCFSVAATKATTSSTSLVTVEIQSSYLMCVDAGTNIVRHPIGNIGGCGQNSTSFYVGAQGQAGATGATGKDGKTLWNGIGDPVNTWGQPGDMYINTQTFSLYGPKNLDGTWPAGVSMIGPKGDQGLTGPPGLGETGARGPAGSPGATGAASTVAGPTGATGAAGTNGTNGTNGTAGADGAGAINTVLSNFGQVVKINWLNSGCCEHGNQKLRIIFSFKNLTGSTIVFDTVGNMNLDLWVTYFNSAGTRLSDTGSPTLTWLKTPAESTIINGNTAEFDVIVDNTSNFASPPAGAVSFSLAFRGQNLDALGVWNDKLGYGMNGKYGPITSFTATPYWD